MSIEQTTEQREGYFVCKDRSQLFYQSWIPQNPIGQIIITHGLSEHSDCYTEFAHRLTQKSWIVHSWDLRGHGKSNGRRGLIKDFQHYCYDLLEITAYLQTKSYSGQLDKPLVLLGHSMGGLITLRSLIDFKELRPTAVALSSPALGIAMPVSVIKDRAAKILARVLPNTTLSNEIDYKDLTHDPEKILSYEKDTLRHDKISPQVYLGMQSSFDYVFENSEAFASHNCLFQLSGQDKIVSTSSAQKLFNQLKTSSHPSTQKAQYIYSQSYHEIFNDIEKDQVYTDFIQFISKLV